MLSIDLVRQRCYNEICGSHRDRVSQIVCITVISIEIIVTEFLRIQKLQRPYDRKRVYTVSCVIVSETIINEIGKNDPRAIIGLNDGTLKDFAELLKGKEYKIRM